MHSQARVFLQPTRVNIHQYQFNNTIIYNHQYKVPLREQSEHLLMQITYTATFKFVSIITYAQIKIYSLEITPPKTQC